MLPTFLLPLEKPLQQLAASWLATGADAVRLCHGEQVVISWGEATAVTPTLQAPIPTNGDQPFILQLSGLPPTPHQARLLADAALLAKILETETDLELMTAEVVIMQDQMLALYDITAETRHHTSLAGTIAAIYQALSRLIPAEVAFIVTQQPESDAPPQIFAPAQTSQDYLLDLLLQIQQNKSHLLVTQSEKMPIPCDWHTLLACPLTIRGTVCGMIGVANGRNGPFSTPDLKLLAAIGQQAESQIEKSLLHEEILVQTRVQAEMELARRVQLHLLPQRQPTLHNLDLAASSVPASVVGGDFFDYGYTRQGMFYFTVGDVTGKGVPAAMVMGIMRTIMRSARDILPHNSPEEILAWINAQLYEDLTDVGMFATVFVGSYDPATSTLQYANAGHSPVIFRPAHGLATMLVADGTAVGVLPTSLSENQTISLGPGDILVVATDGFSEARNQAGALYGYERLLALLNETAELPASQIMSTFYNRIARYSGGHPQDDDQTLLVIKGI